MALKPEDPCSGFRHRKVIDFINQKMDMHQKGSKFYCDNMPLSWEEVENKLQVVLEDSEVSKEAKEACAWGSLALGVRLSRRQGQLQGRRVRWLHDFAKLHKSAAQALASEMKELRAQHEMERKEAAFRLQLAHAKVAELQKERDMLSWKLLQAVRLLNSQQEPRLPTRASSAAGAPPHPSLSLLPPDPTSVPATLLQELNSRCEWVTERPVLAKARRAATGVLGGQEEAAAATGTSRRGRKKREVEIVPLEATQKRSGGLPRLLGAVGRKHDKSGKQREGDLRSVEKAMFYFSGTLNAGPTASQALLPVQLPASFSYPYAPPFPAPSTPPLATARVPAPAAPQTFPHWSASDIGLWSATGAQGVDPPEPQRDEKDSEAQQQRRPPVFRRPGDWDCPWCNAVNFSRREMCFRCGRGIWLQSP
ncbi:testis-expressed protein 13B [Oryctolagus cuniculus]|uniref:testis-expressed protein 13B n=1 Tax=Oryctolagus cuniculus TaxID=9986 RepID=UPI003879921B